MTCVKHPEMIPADPKPAIARPTTKAEDDCAVADTSDPISKRPIAVRKTCLIEKTVYILPNMNWNEHEVKRLSKFRSRTRATTTRVHSLS